MARGRQSCVSDYRQGFIRCVYVLLVLLEAGGWMVGAASISVSSSSVTRHRKVVKLRKRTITPGPETAARRHAAKLLHRLRHAAQTAPGHLRPFSHQAYRTEQQLGSRKLDTDPSPAANLCVMSMEVVIIW
ncbi:hypothetical protein BaRGS_00039525, partial [Batillaria attramentaria]